VNGPFDAFSEVVDRKCMQQATRKLCDGYLLPVGGPPTRTSLSPFPINWRASTSLVFVMTTAGLPEIFSMCANDWLSRAQDAELNTIEPTPTVVAVLLIAPSTGIIYSPGFWCTRSECPFGAQLTYNGAPRAIQSGASPENEPTSMVPIPN